MIKWFIEHPFKFEHPFTAMVIGPSMSGKTQFIKKVLYYKDFIISVKPSVIIYCYKEWQPSYDLMNNNDSSIIFNKGIYDMSKLKATNNNLVILDDLMNEVVENEDMSLLFTVGAHHSNISVFFLTQNIFFPGKFAKTMKVNSRYKIIFRNPQDRLQMQIFARQIYASDWKFLIDAFEDATKKKFNPLILNFTQECEERNRVQSGIFLDEKRIIYTSKKMGINS
jgi:hypothetical protein